MISKLLITTILSLSACPAFAEIVCEHDSTELGTDMFPPMLDSHDTNSAVVTHHVEIGDYILELIQIRSNGAYQARIMRDGEIVAKKTSHSFPIYVTYKGYSMDCSDMEVIVD